jgi:glycosyltransferase involved in cell wall biosynthesis
MRLDVIIPTYNRCDMLARTLQSLLDAVRPSSMEIGVTVVDNNSTDATRALVEQWRGKFAGSLEYVFERRQGRSHALNAGIAHTDGDLVGMIDDDEEVDAEWFRQVERWFSDSDIDFIGGPYLPRWGAEPPEWLPRTHRGVIGWVENGNEVVPFGPGNDAILMGGNAVVRRETLRKVGAYSSTLGRTATRLWSCEDQEMFDRLMSIGARGLFVPELIIYHFVPPARLTRKYHRSWCFWRGASLGVMDRTKREPVVYLLGVPRYLIGNAVRGLGVLARGLFGKREPATSFSSELAVWDLAGFFYGKHLYRSKPDVSAQDSNGAQQTVDGAIRDTSTGTGMF